ncbi:hypothetical protein HDU76_000905 [Blyttiomyces sp. JEL0837]|nr:hypothetical protein HDU76_000905 [Blyttiomyces sp. JEL0837]
MKKETKMAILAILSILFFFLEIAVGLITGSMALVADSFHMLSDLAAIIVGFIALRLAKKQGDIPGFTYGYARAEILGAFTNGIILLSLTFTIFLNALQRFFDPQFVSDPTLVLIVGCLGFGMNLFGMFLFWGDDPHGHDHGHGGHDHHKKHDDHEKGEKHHDDHHDDHHDHGSDMNNAGIFLHAMSDAIGNMGVIASSLVIMLCNGNWKYYMDPVASIIISGVVIHAAIPLVKQSTLFLLQGVPEGVDLAKIRSTIYKIPGVVDVDELHVWGLSEDENVASVHVIVRKDPERKEPSLRRLSSSTDSTAMSFSLSDSHYYTRTIQSTLMADFHFTKVTVQVTVEQDGDALRRIAKTRPENMPNIVLPFLFSVLQPTKARSVGSFQEMVGNMYPEEWTRLKKWVKDSLSDEDYEQLIREMPQLE